MIEFQIFVDPNSVDSLYASELNAGQKSRSQVESNNLDLSICLITTEQLTKDDGLLPDFPNEVFL